MWELLFGDWKTKAWAFSLALLLWYHASQQVVDTSELRVRLLLDRPSNVHVEVKQPPGQIVEVRVRGPRTIVEGLTGEQLRVAIKVASPTEPVRNYPVELNEKMVYGLPHRVDVTGFAPTEVQIEVSQIDTRKLKVLPPAKEAVGTPAPGYEVISITPYPPEMDVQGPVTTLQQAEGIPVDLSSLVLITPADSRSTTRWVSLVEELDGVSVVPRSRVALWVQIAPKVTTAQRSLSLPVQLAKLPGYRHQAQLYTGYETVSVVVEGPTDQVQALTPEQVLVVASVSELSPDVTQQKVTARVFLPPGLKLVGAEPLVYVDVKEGVPAPAANE